MTRVIKERRPVAALISDRVMGSGICHRQEKGETRQNIK